MFQQQLHIPQRVSAVIQISGISLVGSRRKDTLGLPVMRRRSRFPYLNTGVRIQVGICCGRYIHSIAVVLCDRQVGFLRRTAHAYVSTDCRCSRRSSALRVSSENVNSKSVRPNRANFVQAHVCQTARTHIISTRPCGCTVRASIVVR